MCINNTFYYQSKFSVIVFSAPTYFYVLAQPIAFPACCGYMTFAGGFAEANVAKPEAIAKHVFAVEQSRYAAVKSFLN
jgi:hypothetical protein